jgi:hypothetical protein
MAPISLDPAPIPGSTAAAWIGWVLVGIVLLVGFAAIGAMLANYFASQKDVTPWSGFEEETPFPTASRLPSASPGLSLTATPGEPPVQPTRTPTPMPSPTVTNAIPRVYNFYACQEPCEADGSNARSQFPEKTTRIFLRWEFENIPAGALYIRRWTLEGAEWVHYECTWPGPRDGEVEISLIEPVGLHSGTWTVTISVDGVDLLSETIDIEGSWDYWNPPGAFNTCYGQ